MVWLWCPSGIASVLLALLSARMCSGAAAQQKPLTDGPKTGGRNPLTDVFGEFVRQKLDKWKVPGMSLAVVDGHDIYSQGYGFATLPDGEATPETLWYGASTTKAQTAATLAQLIASKAHPGLANGWSTKISSIIRDDFVLQDEWATNHITLEDAASHRTGMPRHDKSSAHIIDGKQVTPQDIVRNLRNLPLATEPRVAFHYCNLMYVTLGHVIETITGKWLGKVLRDVIWDPLGMNSTFLGLEDVDDERLATGYYWDKEAREYIDVVPMGLTEVAGAGSVISSVVDYAQWIKCLLDEAAPFSEDVHKDIKKPRMLTAPGSSTDVSLYGLGWIRLLYKSHVMYTHSGGLNAFGAQVYWLPDAKFGAVAFANTAETSNAVEDIVIYRLIEDKLGIPEGERLDIEKRWEKTIEELTNDAKNATKVLFPGRPDPPLPSTFRTGDLVGTYWDPGYGKLMLHEEPHPHKLDDKILVADRNDMTWQYQLRLHHASGDYWVVHGRTPWNPTFVNEFHPGEFRKGVDGNVSELEIMWLGRNGTNDEGKTIFKRMS